MSARPVALACALVYRFPDLTSTLEEHLKDNFGEVLPTYLLMDVLWWMRDHPEKRSESKLIMSWLENAYENGNDDEKDTIYGGVIEMMPNEEEDGAWLRELMGAEMREIAP